MARRGPPMAKHSGIPRLAALGLAVLLHGVVLLAVMVWPETEPLPLRAPKPEAALFVDLVPPPPPPPPQETAIPEPDASPLAEPAQARQPAPSTKSKAADAVPEQTVGDAHGPFQPPDAVADTPENRTRSIPDLSVLAGEEGLWAVVCQGLDPSLFGRDLRCPDPSQWRKRAGLVAMTGPPSDEAELINPEMELRAVLGSDYLDMSLEDIKAALGSVPVFVAPGLDALPSAAPEIGHLSAADSARERLPASTPDPYLGN